MKTLKNILDTYNWLSEAFIHQTEDATEQDTYSLKNRVIYYKTNDHQPISKWYDVDDRNKSDIPELIISNTYDEESDTGMLLFKEPVTSIGNMAFNYCRSLTSVTIPSSVTSIGNAAFSLCSSLTSISIPEGVTSIGNMAFFFCTSLKSITIPEVVTRIDDCAFFNCCSLEKVFYKGIEYRDEESIINALEDSKVSLVHNIFNCTKL